MTQESRANGAPTSVLIVDDSFLMRRMIRNIVEQDATLVVVGEAADGVEALQRVAELNPDVILLDIEMPHMDGIEFLRKARLITGAQIIAISSIAQLGSPQAAEALALGVADIMPKPSGVLSVDFAEQKGGELVAAIHRSVAA